MQPRPRRTDSQPSLHLSKHLLPLPLPSCSVAHGKVLSWRPLMGRKEARNMGQEPLQPPAWTFTSKGNQQPQRAAAQALYICTQSSPTLWGWWLRTFACTTSDPGTTNNVSHRMVLARAEPTMCWMCSAPHYV